MRSRWSNSLLELCGELHKAAPALALRETLVLIDPRCDEPGLRQV